jgi:hypothetical protein
MKSTNIYIQYINYLKNKNRSYGNKIFYKHRITPGHQNGTYDKKNVVLVTYKEHILTHFYRFLAYQQPGDRIAYLIMTNQSEQALKFYSSLGGKIAGKNNIKSGHLKQLNRFLTKENPTHRSRIGKLGGQSNTHKQRLHKKHFFDVKRHIQKKGNLVRWGIVINNKRIPYKKLSSDFVDYHVMYGTEKVY